MKNVLAALLLLGFFSSSSFAQDKVRPTELGVSFVLNDFLTPQRIRAGSLEQVRREKTWAKIKESNPGIAVTYFKGLKKHIDFAGTLMGSFVNLPLRGKAAFDQDALLLEADASAMFKLFDESYWVSPFFSAGVGASHYRSYYGAFVPLGVGLKVNVFNGSINLGGQYRIPVSYETNNYHLMWSLGFSGAIGKNRR